MNGDEENNSRTWLRRDISPWLTISFTEREQLAADKNDERSISFLSE